MLCWFVSLALSSAVPAQEPAPKSLTASYGHSEHGAAYDSGPRQRAWKMSGIGHAPFPITSAVPEVQEWFDQGNALLHSFSYYEAERAFRTCVELDPDCAMAYLGLARAVPYERDRAEAFLRQALEKKGHASAHEQRWIEAFGDTYLASLDHMTPARPGWNARSEELAENLQKLILDYPDDIEAKAVLVLNLLFTTSPLVLDAMLEQVLAVAPDHPGALHYRIHNWDSREYGRVALDSCRRYGEVAPALGHANHMPAHIYTSLGMWHEGAISLDAATRVEKAYMQERLVLPYLEWNYPHNRNFLAHAQSMLGLPSAALQGAYDMLNAPMDPEANTDELGYSVFREGQEALRRTLLRFERWDEILAPDNIPWRDNAVDRAWRRYAEALAHLGRGELAEAERLTIELVGMKQEIEDGAAASKKAAEGSKDRKLENLAAAWADLAVLHPIQSQEVEGRLRIAKGDTLRGLELLAAAAKLEAEHRKDNADPPSFPRSLYNVLGEAYLDLGSPRPAVAAFEAALESLPNNGWSWAGLARAHHALGEMEEARTAYGHLLHVFSHAEPGVRPLEQARALGLEAEPSDASPAPQRDYTTTALAHLGPNTWQPYAAPRLEALDADGKTVTLADYRGQNVLLVFYLSDQCVHCVEQLRAIEEKAAAFTKRDTVVLAISADPPERNRAGDLRALPFRLLSDGRDHANAIRFKSYDEFEKLELHSTLLIDRQGRLRWVRTGGDPFTNLDFLLGEIDRIETIEAQGRLAH